MSQGDAEAYQQEVFDRVLAILEWDNGLIKPSRVELSGTFPDTEVISTFKTLAGREVTTRHPIWREWWNDVNEWELPGEVAGNLAGTIIEDIASPPREDPHV